MRRLALLLLIFFLPAIPAASAQDEQKALLQKASLFRKHVTDIRGLEFKEEVKAGVYSREELLDFLKKEMERELPRERVEKWAKGYAHFGLIPADLDLYDAILELYSSSIAGFYHPRTRELRLIRSDEKDELSKQAEKQFQMIFGVELDDVTMVHELCHAAQDQNFDIRTLPMEDETNDDMIAALKGVLEGDASIVGFKFGLKDQFDQYIRVFNGSYKLGVLPGKAGQLPRFLRLTLTFPYGYGTDFVLAYIRKHGNDPKRAGDLFKVFPTSTEQILHPEKYLADEPDWPVVISFPKVAEVVGKDCTMLIENVHGEFVTGILLREFKQRRSVATRAARGWDGDRWMVFEDKEGNLFSLWLSVWDEEEDAEEFFEVYSDALAVKYELAEEKKKEDNARLWSLGDRRILIERRGLEVLVLDNVSEAVAGKADDLFRMAVKKELRKIERVDPDTKKPIAEEKPAEKKQPPKKRKYYGRRP